MPSLKYDPQPAEVAVDYAANKRGYNESDDLTSDFSR